MPRINTIHQPAEIKNFILNGALDFWQEKVGTTTTINTATTSSPFIADMLKSISVGSTTKNYSVVRSTDIPTVAQSGFQSTYSALFTMVTGITSPAATDYVTPFAYLMEGFDYSKVHSKTVTIGFWLKASIAGTYSVALQNSAGTRSYVTTVTVVNPNTWEFKAVTVTLDSSGTWLFDTSVGLGLFIGTISGANSQTATLNQWQTGSYLSASTATNYQATSGATVRIAQLSMIEGSLGLGPMGFQRAGKSIQQELAMCQRYYFKTDASVVGACGPAPTTTSCYISMRYPIPMRAVPSLSGTTGTYGINNNGNFASSSTTPSAAAAEATGGIWLITGFTGLTTTMVYQLTTVSSTGALIADARL